MSRNIFAAFAAFSTAVLAAFAARADASVFEIIRAPTTDGFVVLSVNPALMNEAKARGAIRSRLAGQKPAADNELADAITVAGKGDHLNIHVEYLNPLENSWSFSESAVDEPSYLAAGKFIKSFSSMLASIAPADLVPKLSAQESGTPASGGPASFLAARTSLKDDIAGVTSELQDLKDVTGGGAEKKDAGQNEQASTKCTNAWHAPALSEWSIWQCVLACKPKKELFRALSKVDEAFYHVGPDDEVQSDGEDIKTAKAAKTVNVNAEASQATAGQGEDFPTLVQKLGTSLKAAGTFADLREATTQAVKTYEKLVKLNETAASTLEVLRLLSRGNTSELIEPCDAAQPFRGYTAQALLRLIEDAKTIRAHREQVATDIDALMKALKERLNEISTLGDDHVEGLFRIGTIALQPGKVKEVTVKFTHRTLDFGEAGVQAKDSIDVQRKIRIHRSNIVPIEVAPGILATRIVRPKFGTSSADGKTVVSHAGDDIQYWVPALMLNAVLNVDDGPLWPMLQIGVGVGDGALPMFMAGAGVRFEQSVSISAGAVWSWAKDLQTLKLGDTVTGTADIEKDLSYRFRTAPNLYLGIQFGL